MAMAGAQSRGRRRPGWLQSWVLRIHFSLNTAFPWSEGPCPSQLPLALDVLWGPFCLRSLYLWLYDLHSLAAMLAWNPQPFSVAVEHPLGWAQPPPPAAFS